VHLFRPSLSFLAAGEGPTDGATVSVRKVRSKKSYFSSACEYIKLSFSLWVRKMIFIDYSTRSNGNIVRFSK
jgi:hypothetical protein